MRALLVAAVLGLLAAGCSSSSDEEQTTDSSPTQQVTGVRMQNMEDDLAGEPIEGGKLTWGLEAETDGWNPVVNRWALSGHMVGSAIFDPLATLDENGVAVPYLAQDLVPNEDATEWDIVLRPGVVFHDGAPLTAASVKATLDAHQGSVITSKAVFAIDRTEVVDDLTARVYMSEPWYSFPYTLTTQIGYVVPVNMTLDLATTNAPVGTGPFEFVEWQTDVVLTTKKNESYWQEGKPYLAELEFRPMPDAAERKAALLAGEVDAINTLAALDILELRNEELKMVEYSGGEEAFLTLNAQDPPFDSVNARLAVAHAVDIDRYLEETGRDAVVEPARGPFAPGQMGYREDSGYPAYDPDLAREYAAAYEAETGEPLAFTYLGAPNLDDLRGQNSLKAMWEEVGIEVEVVTVPQDDQILNAALGTYQALDFRNFGAPDPDGELVWWHSRTIPDEPAGVSINFPRYGDPEIDAKMIEARGTDDPVARDEAYAEAARLLNEAAPYVWLERVNWVIAANPRVHGIGAAANGSLSTLGAKTWVADLWLS